MKKTDNMIPAAHFLYIAVLSGYYKRKDWQAWADQIILNNDDLELWIYDVSMAWEKEQLYDALSEQKIQEYCNADLVFYQPDVVVGYYCLLYREKRMSIRELTSRLSDEDDESNGAEMLRDSQTVKLIWKIFSSTYHSEDVEELMKILTPFSMISLAQQKVLKEYGANIK